MEVGTKVFADFGRYSVIDVRQGTVERITPSGQVVINFAGHIYKFRDGRQITSDPWHKIHILDEKEAHELLVEQIDKQARRKIRGALDAIKASAPKAEILTALATVQKLVESLADDC